MQRREQPLRRTGRRRQGLGVYVGGRRIALFGDGGARPGEVVNHHIDFGGPTGQQKVLAVRNVADTTNACYARIDVRVGG